MHFPLTLGLGAFTHADETTFLRYLRRAQGGGYSNQDDSNRVNELRMAAFLAAIALNTVERAGAQIWPDLSSELLDKWEQVRGYRNTAARSESERKNRITAGMQGFPSKSRIEAALASMGITSAVLESNVRGDVDGGGTTLNRPTLYPNETILQIAAILSDAEYDDHRKRSDVLDHLEKVLPARSKQHMDDPRLDCLVAASLGCKLATGKLDRSVLEHQSAPGSSTENVRAPSRIKNYGRLSKVRASELNAIQDASLWGTSTLGGLGSGTAGGRWLLVNSYASSGSLAVALEPSSAYDYRDRMVGFFGRFSSNNIRPGNSDDELNNTATACGGITYTNDGTSPPPSDRRILLDADGTSIYAYTDGTLNWYNGGAGARYLVGMLFVSGDLGGYP